MKLRKVLGSFAWVVLAAALILVNAVAANAQDKAKEWTDCSDYDRKIRRGSIPHRVALRLFFNLPAVKRL